MTRISASLSENVDRDTPGPAWPRRLLVAWSPWRPVGGDPCENWAKSGLMSGVRPDHRGAFGPVAIRGPFPQAGQRTTRRGGREAPSTIRCIETELSASLLFGLKSVGKHPAPSGALRLPVGFHSTSQFTVGKHPAPSGALRPILCHVLSRAIIVGKHPAPSGALRQWVADCSQDYSPDVGKHPAPSGALRL